MNKILAVLKREYIAIVKTKTFIIMTIMIPIGLLLIMILPSILMLTKSGTTSVAILDEKGLFTDKIEGNRNLLISYVQGDFEELKKRINIDYDALLHIPNFDLQYPGGIKLIGEKQIGISTTSNLERQIERIIENERYAREGLDRELVMKLKASITIESVVISGEEEKSGSAAISLGIGYTIGFIMYFIIFFYGSMISNSVMSEKKNRIVEILVSSLRPFELMLGKVLGIAAVALTQLLIWIVFLVIVFIGFTLFALPMLQGNVEVTEVPLEVQNQTTNSLMTFLENPNAVLNIPLLTFAVFFYFIFGYLFYSTLFASMGSLADDNNQSQNFMWPITLPIMLSLFLMLHVIESPHSPVAIWSSMIPFCSPIVMLARIPFNVPMWQVWVSMFILVVSIFGSTWLSGKIYRTGILMYGKKLNWKDLWKMIRV